MALMLRLAGQFHSLGLRLAIAGALDTKVFKNGAAGKIAPEAVLPETAGSVIWLGRVSDDELAALLRDSLCLAFPSYVEGFGLPALEAMVVGCPVIASDRASIPEVCGSAALYASPGDEAGWLGHILRLQADPVLRRELSGMGQAQAKKFSWRKSAQLYLGLMNELDASAL